MFHLKSTAALTLFFILSCGSLEEPSSFSFSDGRVYRLHDPGGDRALEPCWSPDGERIVFSKSYEVGGQVRRSALWIINADGTEARELISLPGIVYCARWHPNAEIRKIVFIRRKQILGNHIYSIYSYNLTEVAPEQLYETELELDCPSYTRDGEFIVFIGKGLEEGIYKIPASGGEIFPVENWDGWGTLFAAQCSPTDDLIAFYQLKNAAVDLYTIYLGGGEPTRLTSFSPPAAGVKLRDTLFNLCWYQDGSHIIYTHRPGSRSTLDMYVMNKDGNDQVQLELHENRSFLFMPSMSPDPSKFAGIYFDLWVVEFNVSLQ
ncbi:TolB family protein [candidate division KSB1 bacterium]